MCGDRFRFALASFRAHAVSMSSMEFDFDVTILGAGSGGFAAARTAVAAGLRTAIIEGAQELGGLCILRGCMPTKALLYAAEILHLANHGPTWGIQPKFVSFDFKRVMERKDEVIKDFADYRRHQLDSGKFKLIRAMGHFQDSRTLKLSNGETLTSRHFVIATGSVIAPSPLPELGSLDCLTSDTALKLEQFPGSMIVLGGGAVALEFAQFFARFGVRVTVVQRSNHVLKGFDEDSATEVENAFRDEGIEVYTGTRLIGVRRTQDSKEIVIEHQGNTIRLQAEEVFYALGRVPNIASLALQNAGVAVEGNRIVTNARMQTSTPHIYAAGDCTGLHEIVHVAIQQGEIAARNIAHPEHPQEIDMRLLIEVVFTDPQIASVGLSERRAREQNVPYLTASYPFNDHGKSIIMNVKHGFVKLLADPDSGEILGGTCVGPQAGDLIHEIVAAMHKRMNVQELATMPHYHPTLAEIWTYPAEELAEKVAHSDQ